MTHRPTATARSRPPNLATPLSSVTCCIEDTTSMSLIMGKPLRSKVLTAHTSSMWLWFHPAFFAIVWLSDAKSTSWCMCSIGKLAIFMAPAWNACPWFALSHTTYAGVSADVFHTQAKPNSRWHTTSDPTTSGDMSLRDQLNACSPVRALTHTIALASAPTPSAGSTPIMYLSPCTGSSKIRKKPL